MKIRNIAAAAGLAWAAAGGWAGAQYPEDLPEQDPLAEQKDPVQVSLALRLSNITHAHDALQHRADYDDATRQHWQNGESSGDGWGFTLAVRQGPGELTLRHERLTHDFRAELGGTRHDVGASRQDWELLYWHAKDGKKEEGAPSAWGWQVGVHHITSEKTVRIREGGAELRAEGDVTWKLLKGGYWGVYRPLAGAVRLFGTLHFLFGEVDGIARYGNDSKSDGRIRDRYRPDQGLAYGLSTDAGIGVDFLKYFHATLGYRREWLYSFQSTDSGVVVIPDNDDALFLENIGGFYAELGAGFRF